MTIRSRSVPPSALLLSALLLSALLLLPLVGALGGKACAAPEDPVFPKLEPPVVAIVGGRKLTFDGFCKAVAQQALAEVKRSMAGPRSVLEQLIEERMVHLECKRLGIVITQADVDRLWKDWDSRLRINSNGERTLLEMIKDQGTTRKEFVEQMWHILRKERIAKQPEYLGPRLPKSETARLNQIGIVIKKLREKTDVKYGITTLDHVRQDVEPDVLPTGIVATINEVPVTEFEFGRALVMRLSGSKVREYLDTECKTAILSMQGIKISDAEFDAEIDRLRDLWPLQRELQREEIWSTVSFKDRFGADFKGGFEDVKKSRYPRGLIALVRRRRNEVTEEEIRAEFEKQRDTRFGEYILVSDIQITFAQSGGLLVGGRTRKAALRLARDLVQRQEAGQPFEKICASVNAKKDRSMQAKRLRLYKSATGELAEVHVLRREGLRPARTLEEVRPHIIEVIARRKARDWINEKVKDPKCVRIRWPLSERG